MKTEEQDAGSTSVAAWQPRMARNLLLTLVSMYAGGVVGVVISNHWKWRFESLNPFGVFGVFIGGVITPRVNILELGGIVLCIVLASRKVPRWYFVIVGVWSAAVVTLVRLTWRSP